jgi:hypothetical protein
VAVEVRDVGGGLWLWRHPHPDWSAGSDREPEVSSFAVESRGARVLLDPLAPPPSEREAWERIDAFAPATAVVLKPDHVRDVDLFVRWYGVKAFGPQLYWRDDVPQIELEPVRPGGELRVRATPWYEQRTLPALRALLDVPFERVLVSHGEPAHTREDFVAALERDPWSTWTGA